MKYVINYSFDEKDGRFVAVCPEFVGFIIYCDTVEALKKECVRILKAYTKNPNAGKDIEFNHIDKTNQIELGL